MMNIFWENYTISASSKEIQFFCFENIQTLCIVWLTRTLSYLATPPTLTPPHY